MTRTVVLSEELARFVEARVATGRYATSSDVMREALRRLALVERHDAEEGARLRQAWSEGVASGDAGEIDFADVKKDARARLSGAKA